MREEATQIRGAYIHCSSCTYLFTVNKHIIHIVCIMVFVYQTTTSICTHHQQHAHHHPNKPMQGRPMCKSFIVLLFLLLTKCFAFRFSCLDYDITHPLNDTHPVLPLRASAHSVATGLVLTWQQQWPATTT